jgi:hypothetical protein
LFTKIALAKSLIEAAHNESSRAVAVNNDDLRRRFREQPDMPKSHIPAIWVEATDALGAPLRPTDLLVLDHPLCDKRSDCGFGQARRNPSTRPISRSVVCNCGSIRADVGQQLLFEAMLPSGGKVLISCRGGKASIAEEWHPIDV